MGGEMRVVEIVTKCKHGKSDPHRWEPSTTISDEGWCPGGSRRVLAPGEYVVFRSGGSIGPMPDHGTPDRYLQPGEYVLVKKVDGRWPMTNRVFNAIEDALVRETGSASMRTIETVVETYLDALAEGEQ
jgi:hypothetical protein